MLAVHTTDLNHPHFCCSEEPGETNTVGTGAFDTDTCHFTELAGPGEQLAVTGESRGDLDTVESSTVMIDRGGY